MRIRDETRSAISEVEANPNIATPDKARIVAALVQTQDLAERQEESSREREQQLEVMSLLGVVAGFMTHEFGVCLAGIGRKHIKTLSISRPGRHNSRSLQGSSLPISNS